MPRKPKTKKESDTQQGNPIDENGYYYHVDRLEYKEPSASRGFFITLRPHRDNSFDNKDEEVKKLTEYVKSFTGFEYSVIGTEKNYYKNYETNSPSEPKHEEFMVEEKGYHHHVLIVTKTVSKERKKQTIIDDCVKLFPNKIFPDRSINVRFMDSNKRKTIGYVCKEEDYKLIGDITQEYIDNTLKIYKEEERLKQKKKYKTAEEREDAAIKYTSDFMKKNNLKLNFYTGGINGITKFRSSENKNIVTDFDLLNYLLIKDGFLDLFTRKDNELVRRMLTDAGVNSIYFPTYNPHMSMFKYADCYVELKERKIYTLEEGKQLLAKTNEDPVLEMDVEFSNDIPQLYYEYVSRFTDYDKFKVVMREILLPAVKGGKCLYLYGDTGTGKTVMYDLFCEIFKNVIKNYTDDDRFSWSNVATCPKVAIDECNLHNPKQSIEYINQFKKILNGDAFDVAKKNSLPIKSINKNGIFTSNCDPFSLKIKSDMRIHLDAVNRRLYIYELTAKVYEIDLDYLDKMKGEIPLIIAQHI